MNFPSTTALIALACVALTSACAVQNDKTQFKGMGLTYSSNVKPLENGNFYVESEAAPIAGRIGGASGSVHTDATKFCAAHNKSMKTVKETKGSHLLVNGVARLEFQCL